MKQCKICKEEKDESCFYKYKKGLFVYCKPCARDKYKQDSTVYRRENFQGMWLIRYRRMTDRVEGRAPHPTNAKGKDLLPREQFLEWCARPENLRKWKRLHKQFVASGYEYCKTITVDRIDSQGGYTIDNIQWLSMEANASKGDR